ncbi:PIN domain-containing protein [Terracidiphilus gabretensis]|uniref:PIN domain-containing protein n=1 Tax=Terracidiphilus gabretensis TaxID=1577687 RepID=UPI00071B2BE2
MATAVTLALPRAFFDANVLIYVDDGADSRKQAIAADLVEAHVRQQAAVVSIPVLGEYFTAAVRKLRLDAEIARSQIEFYARLPLVELSITDVLAAVDMHRLHGFSYFDSLHLRCAQRAGCRIFFSEDMHHGQVLDGVRIVNPFL